MQAMENVSSCHAKKRNWRRGEIQVTCRKNDGNT